MIPKKNWSERRKFSLPVPYIGAMERYRNVLFFFLGGGDLCKDKHPSVLALMLCSSPKLDFSCLLRTVKNYRYHMVHKNGKIVEFLFLRKIN